MRRARRATTSRYSSDLAERLGAKASSTESRDVTGLAAPPVRVFAGRGGALRDRAAGVRGILGAGNVRSAAPARAAGQPRSLPRRSGRISARHALGQDRDLLRAHRLVRLRRLPGPPGMAGARGMAGLARGGAGYPAAPHLEPAAHQAAQPVRPRRGQPRQQDPGTRADRDAPRGCGRARASGRRRSARLQRARRVPRGAAHRTTDAARRRGDGDRRVVRPARARRASARSTSTAIPTCSRLDKGSSKLGQGCVAQSTLVEVERWNEPLPPVTAHRPPPFVQRGEIRATQEGDDR